MASGSEKVVDLEEFIHHGLNVMVLAFGRRVGIVDAFLKLKRPCSAQEICNEANLKLRYVQEWLACMVAVGVVKADENDKCYFPYRPEDVKQQSLYATLIPTFVADFPRLEHVFIDNKGPKGYDYNPEFLKFVDEFRIPMRTPEWIVENVGPVFSLQKAKDLKVLEIGCEYGTLTIEMAKLYPESSFTGVDQAKESIINAKENLKLSGLNNLIFHQEEGEDLPKEWSNTFDLALMFDTLHDTSNVEDILSELRRVLKDGGMAAVYDPPVHSKHADNADLDMAKLFLPMSLFSCLPVSMSKHPHVGYGIGWGYESRKQLIKDKGFNIIQVGDVDLDTLQERIVFRKPN